MSKENKIGEFLSMLNELNENSVDADNAFGEVFGKDKPFAVVCGKCGSMDIEIIGERGRMGSRHTGYMEGSTVVKCTNCGNAITAWE